LCHERKVSRTYRITCSGSVAAAADADAANDDDDAAAAAAAVESHHNIIASPPLPRRRRQINDARFGLSWKSSRQGRKDRGYARDGEVVMTTNDRLASLAVGTDLPKILWDDDSFPSLPPPFPSRSHLLFPFFSPSSTRLPFPARCTLLNTARSPEGVL